MDNYRVGAGVLGVFIDALGWDQTLSKLSTWSAARESRYVCFCNVHSVVTANQDERFRNAVVAADMATPDGMPVAWMLRRLGFAGQERVNGPDLMWKYCAMAAKNGQAVYFLGSSEEVLLRLREKLTKEFPGLIIAGHYSPPFRAISEAEDEDIVARVNQSGANMVFVGLGCPKQEIWMAEHRGRINAVMVGVGAAFAIHAGAVDRAPVWMQKSGLEWLHRLASEPKRLWKRYLTTNTIFVVKSILQLLAQSQTPRCVGYPLESMSATVPQTRLHAVPKIATKADFHAEVLPAWRQTTRRPVAVGSQYVATYLTLVTDNAIVNGSQRSFLANGRYLAGAIARNQLDISDGELLPVDVIDVRKATAFNPVVPRRSMRRGAYSVYVRP